MHSRFTFAILLAALGSVACRREKPPPPSPGGSAEPAASAAPSAQRESYALLEHLQGCRVTHRGLFVDLGTEAARRLRSFRVEPFEDLVDAEREGASVSKVLAKKVSFELIVDDPIENPTLSVRAHGGVAKSLWAVLDDKRLGTVRLTPGESRVLEFSPQKVTLEPGPHRLTLGFHGMPRGSAEPNAELDWIRLRAGDDDAENYAAPTFRDVVTDGVLDGVPHRSFALRAPGSVRCPLYLAEDAELSVGLGYWGEGRGTAEVRVIADGEEPATLASRRLTGGPGTAWISLDLSLEKHARRVVELELRALESTRGGRVLFGDPAVIRKAAKEHVPNANTVVIVIAAGLDRRGIPPWGATRELSTLGELARVGAAFSAYRTPTTVPTAVVASLLTGLAPGLHALEDPAARLPARARTLGELVKEASGRTAMFTGVPETFAAFGFDAGWDRFDASSPVSDVPATAPITRATEWLESELAGGDKVRRLVVIHTRGGHPPWDVTRDGAARLPPEEYGGLLDARRGGVVLSKLRSHAGRHRKRLADEDWTRLKALTYAALLPQDVALGQLVSMLKRKQAWDSTLFVVIGDAPPGDPPDVPFDPAAELREDRLLSPLLVKFPGNALAAKDVAEPVTTVDLAATVLAALRLEPGEGLDLYAAARGQEPLAGRPLVATLGDHYATRLGTWLLRGQIGKAPTLCQLDVDPVCGNDVMPQKPVAAWATWLATYAAFDEAARHRVAPREPASIDPDTGAALMVWGDI
jgi:arylsulfatase A-like enzyme